MTDLTPLVVVFSYSVVSDSLRPSGLHDARLPSPLPISIACSNSCLLNQWCHPTISSSVTPFSSCVQSFPASGLFSNESRLRIRWPKYWSFSISPSNEYSGLISFKIDWFDLLAVQAVESRQFTFTFLAVLCHMLDLTSLSRDQTRAHCSESTKSLPLDCQGSSPSVDSLE